MTATRMPKDELQSLQRLQWSQNVSRLRPLYYRTAHNKAGEPAVEFKADSIVICADAEVSFSTFINSFYESTWNEIADLQDLYFEIDFAGHLQIQIFRASDKREEELLVSRVAENEKRTCICIPIRKAAYSSRLFVTLRSLSNATEIYSGSWCTTTKPANSISLRVVICAFNKEHFLFPNLRKLLAISKTTDELRKIIVVDQSDRDLTDSLEYDYVRNSDGFFKLQLIRQPNFGGSGGFTRGIIEAIEREDTTHILLMDDDVAFEPFVIDRLIATLRYSNPGKVIGGQMLEHEYPTRLYASDERFDFEKLQPVNPLCGIDLTEQQAMRYFDAFRPSEYNGWWFCCFPRSAFEPDNLPLPLFVRGDDIELAYRLESGSIVTVPGIFVWHESFQFKASALMEYFTARNWLIAGILHSRTPLRRLLAANHEMFWWFITTFRYDLAHARLLALQHFREGPEYIFSNSSVNYKKLAQELQKYTPPTVPFEKYNSGELPCLRKPRVTATHWISDIWAMLWVFFFAPAAPDFTIDPKMKIIVASYQENDSFRGIRAIGILNQTTQLVTVQAASRKIARSLYWGFVREFFLVCWHRNILQAYRKNFRRYATQAFWRSYLKL